MRDPYTFISIVTTIASLLSIIFDVPKKVSVSLKTFILLLSIGSAIFFWIAAPTPNESQNSVVTDTPSVQPREIEGDDDNPDNQDKDNTSDVSTDDSSDSGAQDDLPATSEDTLSKDHSLQIAPIASIAQNIEPIAQTSFEISPIEMIAFNGEVCEKGQNIDYEFVPQIDGVHRFEFSNVPDGTDLRLEIYNSGWERLKSDYDLDNGDGLTISLSAGNTYYLRVQQYQNFGIYTLNVGPKKEIVDVSTATEISDSIQYTDQQNDYLFLAAISGTYRFEFSDVPNGTDLRLEIYNSGWERLKSDYDLDNGDGLTISLSAGNTYYLRVQQYQNFGIYTLNVGPKKEIVDVSTATEISDSIQYTDQQNDYLFLAAISGTYRFEFSGVPDGTDLRLEIYNSGWERIKSDYDLDDGEGLTVSLIEGEYYYLRIQQYRGLGVYILNIGYKKTIVDISKEEIVSDNIQYTHQENDYLFSTAIGGTYRFEFSDVPDSTDLRLEIYNSGWEKLKTDYNLDNGDGLTVSLSSEKAYYIRVSYYRGYGNYSLSIIKQDS